MDFPRLCSKRVNGNGSCYPLRGGRFPKRTREEGARVPRYPVGSRRSRTPHRGPARRPGRPFGRRRRTWPPSHRPGRLRRCLAEGAAPHAATLAPLAPSAGLLASRAGLAALPPSTPAEVNPRRSLAELGGPELAGERPEVSAKAFLWRSLREGAPTPRPPFPRKKRDAARARCAFRCGLRHLPAFREDEACPQARALSEPLCPSPP